MADEFPPDVYIREKLFQPIVDRLQLDPQKAKWSLFRFFAIGMTLSFATTVALIYSIPAPPGTSMGFLSGMLLFTLLMTVGQIWAQVRQPPAMVLGPISMMQRALWILICLMFLSLVVLSVVSGDVTKPGMLITYTMAVSWHVGVAAAFINTCRKPPPPRRDTVRQVSYARA